MKLTNTKMKKGMTLIELTVVILVLLTLISVLFIGAQAYKRGADRAACILNIRNAQQAMRAQMNVTESAPEKSGMAHDEIIGSGLYLEQDPSCPDADGGYTFVGDGNYPALGTLWMTCDLSSATAAHVPKDFSGW